MEAEWWEKVRFDKIGSLIASRLKVNTEQRENLRSLFKKYTDRLSYHDFFNFLEQGLKINLEGWEKDALEERLDRLGMAFIEFNELNEFCM